MKQKTEVIRYIYKCFVFYYFKWILPFSILLHLKAYLRKRIESKRIGCKWWQNMRINSFFLKSFINLRFLIFTSLVILAVRLHNFMWSKNKMYVLHQNYVLKYSNRFTLCQFKFYIYIYIQYHTCINLIKIRSFDLLT